MVCSSYDWLFFIADFIKKLNNSEERKVRKTINMHMKDTYKIVDQFQVPRPRIICKDGFSMSVQAGSMYYSIPRENLRNGEYTAYEIGFPSQEEELLYPFAEKPWDYDKQVYGYIPMEIVEKNH